MTENEFEIFKIIVDKGLIAIIVALFAYFLTRSVEKLKSSLAERVSWSGELLKQRLDVARQAIRPVVALSRVHNNFVRNIAYLGNKDGKLLQEILELAGDLEIPLTELSVYGAHEDVVSHLENIKQAAYESSFEIPPAELPRFDPNDIHGSVRNFEEVPDDQRTILREWADGRAKLMENHVLTLRKLLAKSLSPPH